MSAPNSPATPSTMSATVTKPLIYAVHSVEKTEAPGGAHGQDWHRYVLKNNSSTITGVRRGSPQLVREYATQYAEQLNTRIVFGPSTWNPRGRKPGPRNNEEPK